MIFEQYKTLARKVFPDLPESFETMSDELSTYQFMTGKFDSYISSGDNIDFLSLRNMTELQMKHINLFSKTFWGKK
jgi:hypothetical protein